MTATEKESKLKAILETERLLNEIKDTDVLLERILTEARSIVNADAGSIYVIEDKTPAKNDEQTQESEQNENSEQSVYLKNKILRIKYAQNDTQLKKLEPGSKSPYVYFTFDITEKSIAGYTVLSGKIVNLPDAYCIDESCPYSFNASTDKAMNYRTKSMLTVPLITTNNKTLGVLQIINAQNENGEQIPFDDDAILFINHFASSATQALEHAYLTSNMIMRMQRMAEYRDPKETYQHVQRVSEFAKEIYDKWAISKHIPKEEMQKYGDILKIAAKCHDLGKVGVSDVILKKPGPGRFTEEERSIMKGHTCIGAILFTEPESELDSMARDVALRHHEWWDGSENGYPGKINYNQYVTGEPIPQAKPLKGTEIPLSARIVAIADVFDALSHKRVYKSAWSVDDAFIEIQKLSGKQFDPELVLAFLSIKERICAINSRWESKAGD